jgi:hypothetical protein
MNRKKSIQMPGLEKMDRYPFRVYTLRKNKPDAYLDKTKAVLESP